MPDPDVAPLTPEERTARAASFGGVAAHHERYRQGPPAVAVDWILPDPVGTVVDLGAGTGELVGLPGPQPRPRSSPSHDQRGTRLPGGAMASGGA